MVSCRDMVLVLSTIILSSHNSNFVTLADTSNPEGVAFEALCRAHIRAFAEGAEKYAAETNLTKRVGEWQSKLAPILEEEEHRSAFDIHEYGQRVIDVVQLEIDKKKCDSKVRFESAEVSFGLCPYRDDLSWSESHSSFFYHVHQDQNGVTFETVTSHCEHFEVCRLFLASLSLSNSGNVQLTGAEGGRVSNPDSLRIELLDTNIDRPMETYLAPSAIAGQEGVSVQ